MLTSQLTLQLADDLGSGRHAQRMQRRIQNQRCMSISAEQRNRGRLHTRFDQMKVVSENYAWLAKVRIVSQSWSSVAVFARRLCNSFSLAPICSVFFLRPETLP